MNTATVLLNTIQGIPAPRPHYADDFMVCGILVCAFILAAVLSDRKGYIIRLLKGFFLPRENSIEGVRTTNIIYFRISMYIVSFASVAFLLTISAVGASWAAMSCGEMWLLSCVSVVLFYMLRVGVFAATNRIFFDSVTTFAWEQAYACWTLLSSVPLYLLTVVAVFFNLSAHVVLLLLVICVALLEICLLYKAFHIFSAKKYGILQIFIYLCTLELMPLLVAGKALVLFV